MKTILIIAIATIGLSGCVIVPFPMPSKTQVEQFEKEDFSFIEEGNTTLTQVEAELNGPRWIFAEPTRWVYLMRRYTGGRWNACVGIGAVGFAAVDCGPISDGETRFKLLEIEFDDAGVVTEARISKVAIGDCNGDDWCMDTDGVLAAAN